MRKKGLTNCELKRWKYCQVMWPSLPHNWHWGLEKEVLPPLPLPPRKAPQLPPREDWEVWERNQDWREFATGGGLFCLGVGVTCATLALRLGVVFSTD